jgi:hypothetical protein
MYKKHTICRACGYGKDTNAPGTKTNPVDESLKRVFGLGRQPLANAFASKDGWQSAFYPLEVLLCPRCHLAQLSATVPPEALYRNYAYVTSKSNMMRDHFSELWGYLSSLRKLESVVEIGSNDGDFLEFAKSNGAERVFGIDPAENLVQICRSKGIQSAASLFDVESAGMAAQVCPCPDLVIARHVFCHIDDWSGFFHAMHTLCGMHSLIAIEVPYVRKMLDNVEFDTIYHEHLSYLNIGAMVKLLENTPFEIVAVKNFEIHGGSIVLLIKRRGFEPKVFLDCSDEQVGEVEWDRFAKESMLRIKAMQTAVWDRRGKVVVGFGASAKSTVWINACCFGRGDIRWICDSTPQKWYKFSPGSDIPIVDEGMLLRERPDFAVCFAWNFRKEIIAKNKRWMELGGKFIFPSPGGVEIV